MPPEVLAINPAARSAAAVWGPKLLALLALAAFYKLKIWMHFDNFCFNWQQERKHALEKRLSGKDEVTPIDATYFRDDAARGDTWGGMMQARDASPPDAATVSLARAVRL